MNGSARNGTSLASLTVMSSGVTPDPMLMLSSNAPFLTNLAAEIFGRAELAKFWVCALGALY
jgi:hypothetical protein